MYAVNGRNGLPSGNSSRTVDERLLSRVRFDLHGLAVSIQRPQEANMVSSDEQSALMRDPLRCVQWSSPFAVSFCKHGDLD